MFIKKTSSEEVMNLKQELKEPLKQKVDEITRSVSLLVDHVFAEAMRRTNSVTESVDLAYSTMSMITASVVGTVTRCFLYALAETDEEQKILKPGLKKAGAMSFLHHLLYIWYDVGEITPADVREVIEELDKDVPTSNVDKPN